MEDMRTVRQWSLRSGISYATLLDAVKSGDLPSFQFKERGQIFVRPSDFDDWLEKAKTRAIQTTEQTDN